MQAHLIVMLTHNDVTVDGARDVFNSCKDLPVSFWGFKNVGISRKDTHILLDAMKKHNKVTCLEVVTYTEESCLENAAIAVELGFDYLTGTRYFPSVAEYLRGKPVRYYPFVGDVGGSPVVLKGAIKDIVDDCRRLEQAGVDGLDLVAFRYTDGNPVELARQVIAATKTEVIVAGSISSEDRLRIIADVNPFAFTMGSALFDKQFAPTGDFRSNLENVIDLMNSL